MNRHLLALIYWQVPLLIAALCGEVVGQSDSASAQEPVTITMMPGLYMPGRSPLGVGPELTQLAQAAREYERVHPHVRIVLQSQGGADLTEGEYIKTQIMGGMAPDIVAINAEAVWPDVDKGWWIALDEYLEQPNPYVPTGSPGAERWADVFANPAITRAKQAPNGQLYSLTYDLVETGIFYNKDIFNALNLSLPRTWAEFIELQQTLAQAGYVPLAVSIIQIGDWGQDYLFDQFFYPILDEIDPLKAAPELEAYFQGYLFPEELCWGIERGFYAPSSPRYREMWRVMHQWRRYWPKDIIRPDRTRLFVLQKAPMLWDGSWFARRLQHDPLVSFQWGVFYLPPITRETSPWASGVEPAVVGGAGTQYSITRSAIDRGHLDQVLDFLAYLTTPTVAERIIGEAGMFIPNIAGAKIPPELNAFQKIIHYRYCTAKWWYTLDSRFNDVNRRLIELYLGDALPLEAFLQQMHANNRAAAQRMITERGWTFSGPPWEDAAP